MQDFLNKAGKSAAKMATKAGNKASELVEVGKLKSKLSDVKQAKETAKKDIGDYCYNLYLQDQIADPQIKALCEKISDAIDHITELEAEIEQVKAEADAKNADPEPSLND